MSASGWVALRLRVPAAREDDVAAALGTEGLGMSSTPAAGDAVDLVVYAATFEAAAAIRARLLLRAVIDDGPADLESVEDERWVERYQASLAPLPLGERFVVVPGRASSTHPGRIAIRLVPGRAFGTGEHPTTRLCAVGLERAVRPGSRWLDLGTGTGVLAIVASRCGASRVLAVDVDPDAVEVAREVVRDNGDDAVVRVEPGSLGGRPAGAFDGVVANVSEALLLENGREIARVLRRGGVLIASGFLLRDAARVREALHACGLDETAFLAEGDWGASMSARR